METANAQQDLAFVKDIVQKTSQRIDAHAFHCVHWGLIVLIWYPVANWFGTQWQVAQAAAQPEGLWATCYVGIGIAAVILGTILSIVRGAKASMSPRLPGGNLFISRQLAAIAASNLIAGFVLSGVAPANDFIDGPNVPIIWGFVYANMAFMMGVAYSREFMISGVLIFAGCITAIFLQQYNGYILGPVMGLGMLIPGLRAEARVRQLQLADGPSDSD